MHLQAMQSRVLHARDNERPGRKTAGRGVLIVTKAVLCAWDVTTGGTSTPRRLSLPLGVVELSGKWKGGGIEIDSW